jgi:excisionase family DNA binding protein
MQEVISYGEAAAALGCAQRTIYRRIAEGRLRKRFTGRRLRNGQREKGVRASGVKAILAARIDARPVRRRRHGLCRRVASVLRRLCRPTWRAVWPSVLRS